MVLSGLYRITALHEIIAPTRRCFIYLVGDVYLVYGRATTYCSTLCETVNINKNSQQWTR